MSKNARIYIGNIEVAGHYKSLAKSMRNAGYPVTIVGSSLYKRDPEVLENQFVPILYERVFRLLRKSRVTHKILRIPFNCSFGLMLLLWSAWRHDYYILYGGSSFVHYAIDYRLLNALGKTVVVNCGHGSEARPPYLNSKYRDRNSFRLLIDTYKVRKRAEVIENNSTAVIGLPCLSHFFLKKMVSREKVGKNVPVNVVQKVPKSKGNSRVRIAHIPSDPVSKGTSEVREAVDYVKRWARELSIDYVELTDIPNSKVLTVIEQADIIITQMFSDIPWPTTAIEAAALSTLPIVGGLEAPSWCEHEVHEDPEPVFIKSEDVKAALMYYVQSYEARRLKSRELSQAICQHSSREEVAGNYIKLLFGEFPEDWFFEPREVAAVAGDGLSRTERKRLVSRYISAFGERALMIPNLKRAKAISKESGR